MTDYELEKYIKDNIEKIIKIYMARLKQVYDKATIDHILEHTEDLRFIKHMENKEVKIGVIDVKDREGKSEEQA